MINIWLDIYIYPSLPEYPDIIAPLEMQTKPSSFNCDIVYTP